MIWVCSEPFLCELHCFDLTTYSVKKSEVMKLKSHDSKHMTYRMWSNISSVVEFQRWWVLKSKLFAKESTCWNENFDTNYLEPLMILSSWSSKSWLVWNPMWNFQNTVWNRHYGDCLQLLGFWNFFVFFPIFSTQFVPRNSNLVPKIM